MSIHKFVSSRHQIGHLHMEMDLHRGTRWSILHVNKIKYLQKLMQLYYSGCNLCCCAYRILNPLVNDLYKHHLSNIWLIRTHFNPLSHKHIHIKYWRRHDNDLLKTWWDEHDKDSIYILSLTYKLLNKNVRFLINFLTNI